MFGVIVYEGFLVERGRVYVDCRWESEIVREPAPTGIMLVSNKTNLTISKYSYWLDG